MTPLERVTMLANRNGDLDDIATPRPLLTLAEFFDGNDVLGSIGANLVPPVMPCDFYSHLKEIAARREVAEVRVQITLFDCPEDWPFSDTIWVITSAAPFQVRRWFSEATSPDECWAGWPNQWSVEECPVPDGMRPVGCWWD